MFSLAWVKHLFASLLAIVSLSVHADPKLTLDEAIALAAQEQPVLQALDAASASSREAAVASSQLPDPTLSFGVANMPITSSDAFHFNRDDMTMSTIGIMQEMVPLEKREAEAGIMQATAEQYQAEKAATRQSIQRDIALAWLNVFEAQRRTELYQQLANEVEAQRKLLLNQVSTGATDPTKVLELDTEISMVKDKRLLALRDERVARAALARWIGPSAQRPLPEKLPTVVVNVRKSVALQDINNHPLLENAYRAEDVARAYAERAKAERELDWSWSVMYGKRQSGLSDMVSFQVSIDLPWDRPNRQDRLLAEKELLSERAKKLTEDRRRALLAELETVLADADTAKAREAELQANLIPAAEARLEVAEAGYAAGKENLSEVWNARQALVEVQLEHWSILTDEQRAAVKLAYLLSDDSSNWTTKQ